MGTVTPWLLVIKLCLTLWRLLHRKERPCPPSASTPAPWEGLWYPGSSAFWLDPDLFTPVEDPHRDICWMLLDQRPRLNPCTRQPIAQWSRAEMARDRALLALADANDYEERGLHAVAAMMRHRASLDLRVTMEETRP